MGLMTGKKGIIFGVSNKRGIAYAIANALHQEGAEIAFTFANDTMESRVRPIAEAMDAKIIEECDVINEDHIKNVFKKFSETYDSLDFVVHAVAFANRDDLTGDFSALSKEGWDLAMGVSAYSLIPICKYAKPLMTNGGGIVALTYIGGEKYVPNYNVMGIAKAALECNVRYLAYELGEQQIRVNAISAGPVKTLAFKGISNSDILLKISEARNPMKRNITLEEVGNAGLYFCSDLSKAVTAETHHVDCGMHSVLTSKEDAKIVGLVAD
ncbi:NADH-specific enoyl-ACP reductase [Candidatus Marinamargulisbacteria bacterium SCGC AAA071-K20]|nr:NADH-specific enoyl-ACP reductase [Candidatus Marinamargulisbacteria bacterium SCGC AAA071-K20]